MTNLDSINSGIAGIDTALDLTRELWLAAVDPADRAKYRAKIDGLLDQRLVLMKQRDQLAAT